MRTKTVAWTPAAARFTFDLLLVPEPAEVGGGLAALGHAGQSDVVALDGGFRQAVDLRPLWDT